MSHTPGPWTARGFVVETAERKVAYTILTEDARLIAAAPDLLAALERIAAEPEWGAVAAELIDIARAAVAKAKGEA